VRARSGNGKLIQEEAVTIRIQGSQSVDVILLVTIGSLFYRRRGR
jgi:hypothetical protein